METFLLNPNVAAQNPNSQQGVAAVDSDGEGNFSPLLNEAVANQENGETTQGHAEQQDSTEHPGSNSVDSETDPASNTENTIVQNFINTIDATPGKSSEAFIPAPTEALVSGQLANTAKITTELPKETLQLQGSNPAQILPEKEATFLPQESPAPVTPPGSSSALASTSKVESLLLQQIQQILDQGKSSASIVISGSNSPTPGGQSQTETLHNLSNPLLADTDVENGVIQTRQVAVAVPTTDDTSIASQKSVKLEGAHQDISEQYLNAKIGGSKNDNSENLQQNNSQQKNTEQQLGADTKTPANGAPGATGIDAKPGDSSFGQQLGLSSSTSTPTTPIEGKLAPGVEIPVPEREMVNTLIQRFNVNPRLQTSKLTMQLHPAELGALKIDLLVKDDSIKANIVAQSQQVLETLEKHMPRLRTILQEQGFTVDAFEISLEGDGGNQKELFQEHFSSQQQEFASNGSSSQNNQSFDTLLDSENESAETDEDTSGVNLTV